MSVPIYLDYNATTPVAPEVAEAMLAYLREHFGNPSSDHVYGRRAAQAVAAAREAVAGLIGAPAGSLCFTGCATEANNLALRGVARALRESGRHLIISAVEHPSVIGPAERLRADGWAVTVLPVDECGQVDPQALEAALRPDTVLVSVMLANNEVGTLQPVAELAALTRPRGILLHTDAAQAVGKIPVNVDDLGVDLLTLAGHKFYAPKGVGALYVRPGTSIEPLLVGGGQEQGLRPGTENVPHIVALGAAARLAATSLVAEAERLQGLRDRLHARLQAAIAGLRLNGHPDQRLPNTLNLSFPDVTGRALLDAVADSIAASVGSACHEDSATVSGVLAAMGLSPARARGAVRLSVGRFTANGDIDRAADVLRQAHARLSARD
ncbi:cysteine desulfurase [Thiohalobacter thiocyanaticus]|uniref:cysteine desulfurase n=1 Tax=Thiohalobacter thiocyanaticus TaxID=585455 RepID=A0A1Z4VU71_9GAMM|nr:cysteine desulfurase family protein [Thiohalobacter thiocyanaticus]BAZ95187.1 cysteine desulfurase [Thiohalobacter thiocyanaticus]